MAPIKTTVLGKLICVIEDAYTLKETLGGHTLIHSIPPANTQNFINTSCKTLHVNYQNNVLHTKRAYVPSDARAVQARSRFHQAINFTMLRIYEWFRRDCPYANTDNLHTVFAAFKNREVMLIEQICPRHHNHTFFGFWPHNGSTRASYGIAPTRKDRCLLLHQLNAGRLYYIFSPGRSKHHVTLCAPTN